MSSVSIHASSREDATQRQRNRVKADQFQSTRPRGRTRHGNRAYYLLKSCFNPRVLAGGRDRRKRSDSDALDVSIHASSREDATIIPNKTDRDGKVSIHASSREDATRSKLKKQHQKPFQSTRPRGRTRQAHYISALAIKIVSIHASSREDATRHISAGLKSHCFNPRVLAGGRDFAAIVTTGYSAFQSTRPRGRTRPLNIGSVLRGNVSIHASSREDATFFLTYVFVIILCFNPRVLAGGRDSGSRNADSAGRFQSTRPRGRTRLDVLLIGQRMSGFNPRVLAGGRDGVRSTGNHGGCVSIHASSREDATTVSPEMFGFWTVSIHASSREDATSVWHFECSLLGFNPRVLAGGRDYRTSSAIQSRQFQSTRPRGRTRPSRGLKTTHISVSIHASSREDATLPAETLRKMVGFNPRVLAGGRDFG